ncbi:MAG: hypothetical protein KA984_01135 [Candidatus Cloacimonetes bacterium]|nr:hypothetical protein [Candidatus Cloacimonadota bacterium]
MKHICYISLAVLLLLIVSACEKGASFEVINQCSYPAWVSVDGDSLITLAAGETRSFKIATGTESILSGSVYESFKVIAFGETFSLEREVDGHLIPTDSTTVKIRAGETRRAPLIPNRASLKVTNNSSNPIEKAEIWKHTALTHTRVGTIYDIEPGTNKFYRGEYAVANNMFYYTVLLYFPGMDEPLGFGGENTILGKDEQFNVIYADPE